MMKYLPKSYWNFLSVYTFVLFFSMYLVVTRYSSTTADIMLTFLAIVFIIHPLSVIILLAYLKLKERIESTILIWAGLLMTGPILFLMLLLNMPVNWWR
jgi:NhaP-type Na+/H+ and K+/H+ antiporter